MKRLNITKGGNLAPYIFAAPLLSLMVGCSSSSSTDEPAPDPELDKPPVTQTDDTELEGDGLPSYANNGSGKPNVIVILVDDLGYQDIGCFGSPLIKTPNLDRIAANGLRLTDFYVSASVSSASRAGLMTGRMNDKNGVGGVLFPGNPGLDKSETIIPEALKDYGYATACYGKWHLGCKDGQLPRERGYDDYFGIPYSNDMYLGGSLLFSEEILFLEGYDYEKSQQDAADKVRGNVPLMEDDEIVEYPCFQETTTQRYIDRAIDFIDENKNSPFFIYITPAMPHIQLHASEQFLGTSARGLYGDVVEEIDWNVGRLLDYLDQNALSSNTLVVWTSDNGPWLGKGENGGCALPLRNGKYSLYEGGVRMPCVMQWKGVIPAGSTSDAIVSSLDLFPTILSMAGESDSSARNLDGYDLTRFLRNPTSAEECPRQEYYYVDKDIYGVRYKEWKYLVNTGLRDRPDEITPELFNLKDDISEEKNVVDQYPEKVEELKAMIEKQALLSK